MRLIYKIGETNSASELGTIGNSESTSTVEALKI